MQLHDTHFHLDLMSDPVATVTQIEQAKIYTIAVTNLPDLFEHTRKLTSGTKYLRPALGFHPELAAQHSNQIAVFRDKIGLTKYVGEVGLDNYKKSHADYAKQKEIFEQVIEICHEAKGKILTVHSRRSEKDVISIIGQKFSGKVILHWYSGSLKELDRALEYDFYFSINLAMCQSDNGRKVIERVPHDKLLIETDGPFVTTNGRPTNPIDTQEIARRLLTQRGRKVDSGKSLLFLAENFKKLLV